MTYDLLTALAAFAFVTSITPGPNNLMLMTSGANYGFWRTIPHMLGIGIGFCVMVVLVGAGVVGLFEAFPISYTILKVLSVAYMLYLAWKIATAAPASPASSGQPATQAGATQAGAAGEDQKSGGTPMTFLQAALFQWVNPKAWAMALTSVSVYAPERDLASILLVALVFGAINLPSVGSWTILGQQLRRFLTNPTRLRAFNWGMAILLVASLYPVLL